MWPLGGVRVWAAVWVPPDSPPVSLLPEDPPQPVRARASTSAAYGHLTTARTYIGPERRFLSGQPRRDLQDRAVVARRVAGARGRAAHGPQGVGRAGALQ